MRQAPGRRGCEAEAGGLIVAKLYCGNLNYSIDESGLFAAFASYGVTWAKIARDDAGKSRGYAFVEIEDGLTLLAIEQMNQSELSGRRIKVAVPRRAERDT